ncbi:MAG: DUF4304 domain-containing protein [Myxococcales bacterium]
MTVPKSSHVAAIDHVERELGAKLKAVGFKKKGRTFNRSTEDGVVQVINIQMGSYDPPGTTYIPGLRENLYGWFTINLGVYVPEVAKSHGGGEVKDFVREYHCCIRDRLGHLGPEKTELWWRNDAAAEVLPDLLVRIDRDGLPFLARFGSRDAILRELDEDRSKLGGGTAPPRIVKAIILVQRGDRDAARDLLAKQAQETLNPGHPAYVRSLAAKLGIPLAGS